MKKFFSFIFVTLFVTSLSANSLLQMDGSISKKQAFKELTQRKSANMFELRKQPSGSNQSVLPSTEELPSQRPYQAAAKKASNAATIDTIDLYFDSFYNDPIYYEVEVDSIYGDTIGGGDWYIVLTNERYQFIFDYYNLNPDDCTGTYTVDDTDVWAWAKIPEANGKSSYYETCDFTVKAEKVSDNLTRYTLEAFVTVKIGWEGEVYAAFNIVAEHTTITPSKIVETAFVDASITPEEDMFTIVAKNDSMTMNMPIFSEYGVQGYYNASHIDIDNCLLTYNKKKYTPMRMEAIITTADLTTGGVAYVAFMEVLTTDTTFFNIVLQAPITPIDTVEIEMPVEFINAMDYGYYTLAAYTPDSAWYVSLTPLTDEVAGTFVNDGLFGKFGEEKYDFSDLGIGE